MWRNRQLYLSEVLGDGQTLLQAVRAAGRGWNPQGATPLQDGVPLLGKGELRCKPLWVSLPEGMGHRVVGQGWHWGWCATLYSRCCIPFKLLLACGA